MEITTHLIPWALGLIGFFVKLALFVVGVLIILSFAIKEKVEDKITIKDLNRRFKNYKNALLESFLDKKTFKKELKKQASGADSAKSKPRCFVVTFQGDIKASAVNQLKEVVTAILTIAQKEDEVVVNLESPGGMVHGYGLAASQLQRIKDAQIPLTICVDKVAASGGYMMACLADKIVAAPFAIIGSVGVVASIPNFNKILKKNDIDYHQITSGKFKRTLTLLGEVNTEGLDKFKEEIEETHTLFKDHIRKFRPQVDVEKISTGEHWYGQTALQLNLIDELGTSDDYLYKRSLTKDVKEISFSAKKSFKEKLAESLASSVDKISEVILDKMKGL
jgi:serine protease SohB